MSENSGEKKSKRHRRHRRRHYSSDITLDNLATICNTVEVTNIQRSSCDNVELDRQNLATCCQCMVGTMRFLMAFFTAVLIIGGYITTIVLLAVLYNTKVWDGNEAEKIISLAMFITWLVFSLVFLFVIHFLFGNYGVFKTKQRLFPKWRLFLRWGLPWFMYILLWIPLIFQQFEATKKTAEKYYEFCWAIIIVFWCVTVLVATLTFFAMLLLKVKETDDSAKQKDFLCAVKNWFHYNCCCISFHDCSGCGCDECDIYEPWD